VRHERLGPSLRSGIWIVIALNTAYVPLDVWAYPDRLPELLVVRAVLNVVLLGELALLRRVDPLWATRLGCYLTGVALIAVIAIAGAEASAYAPGLMLLFLGMPVLLPLSAREAGRTVGALLAVFAAAPFASGGVASLRDYLLYLFFPAAAAVECVASCALLDRLRFNDFLQRRELERARDELRELDRAKSRFTANLHHELRTPLTLMLAPLEGMRSGELGELPAALEPVVRTMHANGLRLLKLISNLLDLAKIESRELRVRRAPLDLARLVRDVVEGARGLAERKGVALEAGELEATAGLCADADALDKVLVNLVGNALKFTDAGGRIAVTLRREGEGAHLAVTDTGAGIPPEQLERIFDRFAQVDDSATRRHEGTGIGLSLVRELVELHEGRVWAESAGRGRGATLHVTLPRGEADAPDEEGTLEEGAEEAAHQAALGRSLGAMEAELAHHGELAPERQADGAAPERRAEEGRVAAPERLAELERNVERAEDARTPAVLARDFGHPASAPEVLVVEDNAEMRALLASILGRRYRVRTAPNGRLALEAVRARRPHVVVTDVMMPEMSGTELCRALRDDPATRPLPVVLVTSKAEREAKIEGLELGADDYVTKPFHPRELLARVGALVRLEELRADVADRNLALERANAELERALRELRDAEVQLVQAERLSAVGELAGGVAHEINNPLNFARNALVALRTYVDDLRAVARAAADLDLRDREKLASQLADLERLLAEVGVERVAAELAELVAIATEGLDRTERLVAELRDFASPRVGGEGAADLCACLSSTLALLRHAAEAAGVKVEADLPEGLPRARGHARALNQVFLNLLKNALDALEGSEGRVRVRLREEGGALAVDVEDDGPGIDPALRERLFEPFVTSKPAGKGTGLGLSISRRIVSECGGTIEVREAPGRGACFTVRVPAESEPAAESAVAAEGEPASDGSSRAALPAKVADAG
jgi:signal transduction histidine kinase